MYQRETGQLNSVRAVQRNEEDDFSLESGSINRINGHQMKSINLSQLNQQTSVSKKVVGGQASQFSVSQRLAVNKTEHQLKRKKSYDGFEVNQMLASSRNLRPLGNEESKNAGQRSELGFSPKNAEPMSINELIAEYAQAPSEAHQNES